MIEKTYKCFVLTVIKLKLLWILAPLLLFAAACSQEPTPPYVEPIAIEADTSTPVPPTATVTVTSSITPTPTNTPTPERFVSVFLGGDEDPLRPERNLIGVRSDVFMIVYMYIPWYEKEPIEITFFSLPRDLWVEVPCSGLNPAFESHDRVNSAYAYGELDCVRETVAANFPYEVNAPIFYTTFDGFIDLIDTMDGITIVPTITHTEWCGNYHGTDGTSGALVRWTEGVTYEMDGQRALCYARGRMGFGPGGLPGDLDRNRRQLELMLAMFEQYPAQIFDSSNLLDMASELIGMWSWADDYVQSDLSFLDTIQYVRDLTPQLQRIRDADLKFVGLRHREQVDFWTTPYYGASVLEPLVDLNEWFPCMPLRGIPDVENHKIHCTEKWLLPEEALWSSREFDD